jgi:predicted adenylyl cyclase CyaB
VVPVSEPNVMLAALNAALGMRGTVRKRRELLLWQNVRIHLDQVESLGTFIELEAVISETNDQNVSHARIEELRRELEIADEIAVSYSDFLGI